MRRRYVMAGPSHTPEHVDARRFVTDLTASLAPTAKEPLLIGREKEIEKVFQILMRKSNNSVTLVGENGVGKTTIVEAMARLIATGAAPNKSLIGCEMLSLNTRGYKTDYVDAFLKDVEAGASERIVVLFIDNVHVFLQRCEDGLGVLEDILSRDYMRCIVATTPDQYVRCIAPEDCAGQLGGFQKADVKEPSIQEATNVVQGLKHRYEAHHAVHITDEAITAAVVLAKKHVTLRFLPDSALDLIDEASTTVLRANQPEKAAVSDGTPVVEAEHVEKVVSERTEKHDSSNSKDDQPPINVSGSLHNVRISQTPNAFGGVQSGVNERKSFQGLDTPNADSSPRTGSDEPSLHSTITNRFHASQKIQKEYSKDATGEPSTTSNRPQFEIKQTPEGKQSPSDVQETFSHTSHPPKEKEHRGLKRLFKLKRSKKSPDDGNDNKTSSNGTSQSEVEAPNLLEHRRDKSKTALSLPAAAKANNKSSQSGGDALLQKVSPFSRSKDTRREDIQLLRRNGFNTKSVGCNKADALSWAADNGHEGAVEYLLTTFGNLISDSDKADSLVKAANKGYTSTLEVFLKKCVLGMEFRDRGDKTILHRVVGTNLDIVRLLLDANANVNAKFISTGRTALHLAANSGYVETIPLLMEYGADINNIIDNSGLRPLHLAAKNGHTAAAKTLLDHGAQIAQSTSTSRTALHLAASSGYVETMLLLVEYGADVNVVDNSGLSPLHFAAKSGNAATVKTLLENDTEIQARSTKGVTALMEASAAGHADIILLLIQNGATVSVREKDSGHTALHKAIKNGRAKAARLLIESNASLYAKDQRGNTAVDMARTYWQREAFQALMEIINQKRQKSIDKTGADEDGEPAASGQTLPDHPQLRQKPTHLLDWSRYEKDTGMVDPMVLRWE